MIIAKRGWHLLHISGTLIHVWNCHSSFSLRCSHASVIVSFFIRGWAHFVNAMLDFRIGSQKSYFKKWLGLFFRFICFLFQKLSIFTFTLDLAFFFVGGRFSSLQSSFYSYIQSTWCTRAPPICWVYPFYIPLFVLYIFCFPHQIWEFTVHSFRPKKNPRNETIIIKMSDINPLFYTFHVAMHTLAHMWDNKMKNKK